jgi:NADPH:quinone reductase-like Zn-dependent oxidoreductase
LVRSFGADLIVARGDDVADRIRALVPLGVPGLVDCATMHALTLPALADGGRLASVRGWRPPVERDIAVALVLVPQRAGDTTTLQEIAQLADKGVLVPRVARVMPAGQAVDAHRLLAAGGLRGRIVLDFTVGVPHSLPNTNLEH